VPPGNIDGSQLVAGYPENRTRHWRRPTPRRVRALACGSGWRRITGPSWRAVTAPVGPAFIEVCRLRNLKALCREARRPNEGLVLAAPSALYRDVLESRFQDLDPEDFFFVPEEAKGRAFPGHIHWGGGSPRRRAGRELIRLRSTPRTPRLGRRRFGKRTC